MSIFLLPKIIHTVGSNEKNQNDIYFKMTKEIPDILISHSLYNSLCQVKIQIEKNDIAWDICKKITNPYEFIHTIVPGYKTQVSKMMPLSRSFYKMIEISTIFNLYCNNDEINNYDDNGTNDINNLLQDYTHNVSPSHSLNHSLHGVKHIEWYIHDNYYYDAHCGIIGGNVNGNKNNYKYNNDYKNDESNTNGCNNGSNNGQNIFRMVKNKNIFYEKENFLEIVEKK